jgi:phage terminase large subunit-like protein
MPDRLPIPADRIRTESDKAAILEGCWYDPAAAQRVIDFIQGFCCHTKARWYGKPFKLLGWQLDYIRQAYGWMRPDGTRRFRQTYVEIPKKNGKSEFLSALVLYHLIADGEMGSEIYLCAYTKNQAAYIFKDCVMMIESSPELDEILEVVNSFHVKEIKYKATRSIVTVMSSDAPSADGKSSALTVHDELHRQRDDKMWNVMEQAGIARSQPMLVSITTAGVDKKSICYRQHEIARQIKEGVIIDIPFLGMVFSADHLQDKLDDPATWTIANPAMGEIIKLQDFEGEYKRSKVSPTAYNNFIRLRLNIWTAEESRFIERDKWVRCGTDEKGNPRTVPWEQLKKLPCYAGLDLANISDANAFVMCWLMPDGTYFHIPWFWLPKDYATVRQERDGIPYLSWAKKPSNNLTLTEGDVADYDFIKAKIIELSKVFKIKKILCDQYNATQIAIQLAAEGLPIEFMRQGFLSMNAPTMALQMLIQDGKFHHANNDVMGWMADNAMAVYDPSDLIKVSKKKSKDKVDGIVSAVQALNGWIQEKPIKKSVYEKRGILTF